ncbi:MAG: PP2C family protein-serine/threonine phosphatase [Gammaproteobacteria bacterium]|nr:PP2C family protein-serine/threonine phosphatase [Gammaproteobacteria bacterium]
MSNSTDNNPETSRAGQTVVEAGERQASELAMTLAETQRKLSALTAEYEDLTLLYEATIAHGEAVEDQLAEANLELTRTQTRLQEEMDEAVLYARSVLPDPRQQSPATDWHYEPSTELGGDLFGYHHIDPDHFAIYLIDVCGHGVGPALLSFSVINVLRGQSLIGTDFLSPSSVLGALNNAFPMESQHDKFFTMWYGVHDRRSGELRYSTGGHPPAVLMRGGGDETELLGNIGNIAIGTFPDLNYSEGITRVSTGDRLIVYSDGAFELPDAKDGMLEIDDLVNFLSADPSNGPKEFYDWVRSKNGDLSLPDDFSLLRILF